MAAENPGVSELIDRYERLLDLYRRLESVSETVFDTIAAGSRMDDVQAGLREKMGIVEAIAQESHHIAGLKQLLRFSPDDRVAVRAAESELSTAVERIIVQEERVRDMFSQQGVNISRR